MANEEDDLALAQLLCSRLCHDLISPVSAIGSGLELLEESGTMFLDDALPLIERSALQSRDFLSFYRAAFGMGGAPTDWRQVRGLGENYLRYRKVDLTWADGGPLDGLEMPKILGQLILNLFMLGAEMLLVGGQITVQVAAVDDGLGIGVAAGGEKAVFRDDLRIAMQRGRDLGQLTARTVQAHYLSRLADALGGQLEIGTPTEGRVEIAALLPDGPNRLVNTH